MIIRVIVFMLSFAVTMTAQAQKYACSNGSASFYSHAIMEDIRAENQKGTALFDPATADIAFVIPIKEFRFAKSLMQEHFNEKYMESEKFPKATFQGKLIGFDDKLTDPQQVKATGKLTIHGVTHEVEIPGKVSRQTGSINMNSTFIVKLEDYKIQIPQIVWQNIAEQVEVTVNFSFKPQNEKSGL